jgi:P-type Ca2+ transporter type 2C
VREGRRVVDNLARAFAYVVSFHPPLLLAALLCPLLGKPLLLLPIHLVTLELLLHPVMSVVFQADLPDPGVMRRPPRPVAQVLAVRSFAGPLAVGVVSGAAVVSAYLTALARGWPVGEARGFAFAAMLVAQPLLVLVARSPDRPLWRVPMRATVPLLGSTLAIWSMAMAVIYLHPVARLLQVEPFPPSAWLGVVGIGVASTLWREPFKRPAPPPTKAPEEGDFRP